MNRLLSLLRRLWLGGLPPAVISLSTQYETWLS